MYFLIRFYLFLSNMFIILFVFCLFMCRFLANMGWLYVRQDLVFLKTILAILIIKKKKYHVPTVLGKFICFLFLSVFFSILLVLSQFLLIYVICYVCIWSLYVPLFWRTWDGFMCAKILCFWKNIFRIENLPFPNRFLKNLVFFCPFLSVSSLFLQFWSIYVP